MQSRIQTSGGASIEGDANILDGDFVGRDKIIFNIVTVGKLLEFANIEGLLPQAKDLENIKSITDAIEQKLLKGAEDNLINATAVVGEVLRDTVTQSSPNAPYRKFSTKSLFAEIVNCAGKLLSESGVWEDFSAPLNIIDDAYGNRRDSHYSFPVELRNYGTGSTSVIFLESTKVLYEKQYGEILHSYSYIGRRGKLSPMRLDLSPTFGIIRGSEELIGKESGPYEYSFFPVVQNRGVYYPAELLHLNNDIRRTRILILGCAIDLIGIVSENLAAVNFLKDIAKSVTPSSI